MKSLVLLKIYVWSYEQVHKTPTTPTDAHRLPKGVKNSNGICKRVYTFKWGLQEFCKILQIQLEELRSQGVGL